MVCFYHFIKYADFRGELFSSDSLISRIGSLGVNGVYTFFVISGFVIPLALSKANFNLKQLPRFLSKRSIRIEIPYFFSILIILFVGFLFAIKNNLEYSVNAEQFFYHIIYFIPFSNFEWYNIIYWTLAIEFQFYIFIGLFYFFLCSEKKYIVILSLLLFASSSFISKDDRFIFFYSPIFLQGIILFLFKTKKIKTSTTVSLIGLFVLATAYVHSIEIAVFSVIAVLIIQFFEINTKITNRLGDVSYSLYLTHGLIGGNLLYLCARYTTSCLEKTGLLLVAVIFSLLFSYLFWVLIEKPSQKLARKIDNL